jgi:hypothetical protein
MDASTFSEDLQARAGRLLAAGAALLLALGLAGTALGLHEGITALWGFGAVCLLHLPMTLAAGQRLREGLGNRGLDRELRTLRIVSRLLRLLAAGMAMAAGHDLFYHRETPPTLIHLALAALALLTLAALAWSKHGSAGCHPTLAQDARQARHLTELAGLLLAGVVGSAWLPWLGGAAALAQALWVFGAAQALARSLAIPVGGCGSCSCG